MPGIDAGMNGLAAGLRHFGVERAIRTVLVFLLCLSPINAQALCAPPMPELTSCSMAHEEPTSPGNASVADIEGCLIGCSMLSPGMFEFAPVNQADRLPVVATSSNCRAKVSAPPTPPPRATP